MASIGDRIKDLRESEGLTQIQLSKKLNISNTTLSQYESGVRVPSDEIKIKIAIIFDVSLNYLMGRTDIKTTMSKDGQQLSEVQKSVLLSVSNLSVADLQKVIDYAELLKLRQSQQDD